MSCFYYQRCCGKERKKGKKESSHGERKKNSGVTLAIDDVFEAWHDESDSDSHSDSDSIGQGEGNEEEERSRPKRRYYCGVLSVPFDFEAPDLGAAVARLARRSLPSTSSTSAEEDEEDETGRGDFLPLKFSEKGSGEERALDVSARGLAAGRGMVRSAGLLPTLFLGRGRGAARRRRSPPPLRRAAVAAVAPRALPPPSFSSSAAPSPFFRRLRVL